MAITNPESILFDTPSDAAKPELLISALLYLMSQYSTSTNSGSKSGPCTKLAAVIERHLNVLAGMPDLAPVLRATCRQLAENWAEQVEQTLQKPAKSTFFTRFTSGATS